MAHQNNIFAVDGEERVVVKETTRSQMSNTRQKNDQTAAASSQAMAVSAHADETNPPQMSPRSNSDSSRRKVQKLRDQSQYISKNVRALQYWRWACGTCCKQYHMLFYIQMAVVSTAIFFLFSPSFSFFLEIKVQIYVYFHNKCQYINQFPPKP